jgi:hypothetical protein
MSRILAAALLFSTALTTPKPAQAGPIIGAVSFLAGGAGFGAVTSIFGFASGTLGFTLALTGLRLGASMALSAVGRALAGTPAAPELIRQAQVPVSLPPKRFIYGAPRIYGSPAWRVQGNILYAALILNSRPSEAVTGLWLDKRACTLTGDMYDLAGAGATADAAPFAGYVTVWCGLGGQTAAPLAITTEASDLFLPTDAGQGMTVLWLRLDAGPNKTRAERWPSFPPEVEVDGQWSKVWDMRDEAQDPDDPETWEWRANQALCTLDAARQNPIRPYPLTQIMVDLFEEAADIADEAVALNAGGSEPRYQVNGGLVWNGSELMDQLMPLYLAGASDPVRVGGKLGIVPGAYSEPVMTLTDITEAEGLEFQSLKPGRDLVTTLRCTITDPARDWRTSELEDYTVPGAQAADGGALKTGEIALPLVTSPTQGMRVQKIAAHRQRAQKTLSNTLPPAAFRLIAGCNVTVDYPAPYEVLNGVYRVAKANPGLSASEEGDGGVAMRVPVVLEEIAASDFAWTPATDEQERELAAFDGTSPIMAPPGAVTTTTGAGVAVWTGSGYAPRIRFAFDASPSASVVTYEWQFKQDAEPWAPGGLIDEEVRDGGDQVFGFLTAPSLGPEYIIRARAIGASASDWVESDPVEAAVGVALYEADFENTDYAVSGVEAALENVLGLTRATQGRYVNASGLVQSAGANVARLDFSTGTRALLVEPAGENLQIRSEELDHATYTKGGATVGADVTTAPDGASTADKLIESAGGTFHFANSAHSFASGEKYTFSRFVNAAERTKCALQFNSDAFGASQRWLFDLTAKTATLDAGTCTGDIEELPGGAGWFRIWITATATATVASAPAWFLADASGAISYSGVSGDGMFTWGAQVEVGDLTSYIPTAGATATRAADVPTMQGITGTMDLLATYGDGSTEAFDASPVVPGFWPALTQTRLRSLIGTI